MRIIKFRGKTKGGIWLYGDVLQNVWSKRSIQIQGI